MKLDAGIALKEGSFSVPRNFIPELIVDVGYQTFFSTRDYLARFPEAEILSFQTTTANFLLHQNLLAYHDKVTFKTVNHGLIDLDSLIYEYIPFERIIDFIKIDVVGREKEIIKSGGRWPNSTRYLKVRLGQDYDYKEAKSDLRELGFYSAAMYDGVFFYVVGERID